MIDNPGDCWRITNKIQKLKLNTHNGSYLILSPIKQSTWNQTSKHCWLFSLNLEVWYIINLLPGYFYKEVLMCLHKIVQWNHPELFHNQSWILHHDNAPVYCTLFIKNIWHIKWSYTSIVSRFGSYGLFPIPLREKMNQRA